MVSGGSFDYEMNDKQPIARKEAYISRSKLFGHSFESIRVIRRLRQHHTQDTRNTDKDVKIMDTWPLISGIRPHCQRRM